MDYGANPYTTGAPVGDDDSFIGREDVITEVMRILRNKEANSITLFGQRRIGKTSLLQYLTRHLPQEHLYHTVFYDLQYKAEWPLPRILDDLAKTIAMNLGVSSVDLGGDIETEFYKIWLPKVLEKIGESQVLVLLFDEFDVLADNRTKTTELAKYFIPYLKLHLFDLRPANLKFIFAIGKNIEDLNSIAFRTYARRIKTDGDLSWLRK